PRTRTSRAMKATPAPSNAPIRSAPSSSSATVASGAVFDSRSAASRAPATSVSSLRASSCRRIVVAKIAPATTSAISAADTADRKNVVWNVARKRGAMLLRRGRRIDQLVAELLHGHEPVDQDRQLLAPAAHVDVHPPRPP